MQTDNESAPCREAYCATHKITMKSDRDLSSHRAPYFLLVYLLGTAHVGFYVFARHACFDGQRNFRIYGVKPLTRGYNAFIIGSQHHNLWP